MAQRSRVPKFGDWESEENVPYTVYFEKARKGHSGGKIGNPNDPQESPDLRQKSVALTGGHPASRARPEMDETFGHGPARRSHERRRSREEGDLRQYAESPVRHDDVNRRASTVTTPSRFGHGVSSGEAQKRPTRPSVGSENSIDKLPLHHLAQVTGRGSMASPAWEGKTSYDGSQGTPGRSRMRPSVRGDESLFQNLVTGMRVTRHQLMVILTFLIRCEKRGTTEAGFQACQLSNLHTTMFRIGSQLTAVLRVAASHGGGNERPVKSCKICCKVVSDIL